jgi:hypothetical protein
MYYRIVFLLIVFLQIIGFASNKHIVPAINGMEKEMTMLLQLENYDIYVIDYSGTISFDKGIANMDLIEKEIRKLSVNKACLKIIFDVRNTIWENGKTHDSLSRIARTERKIFDPNNFGVKIYTAVLNNEIEGSPSENEHWFIKKEDAIQWLLQKK